MLLFQGLGKLLKSGEECKKRQEDKVRMEGIVLLLMEIPCVRCTCLPAERLCGSIRGPHWRRAQPSGSRQHKRGKGDIFVPLITGEGEEQCSLHQSNKRAEGSKETTFKGTGLPGGYCHSTTVCSLHYGLLYERLPRDGRTVNLQSICWEASAFTPLLLPWAVC